MKKVNSYFLLSVMDWKKANICASLTGSTLFKLLTSKIHLLLWCHQRQVGELFFQKKKLIEKTYINTF